MKFFIKLQTLLRIGLLNIARVALYRSSIRIGMHPVMWAKAKIGGYEFFTSPCQENVKLTFADAWNDNALYFGWYKVPLQGRIPLWHANPFNGAVIDSSKLFWWRLSDFDLAVGDIKTVWEASRFDWVLTMAQRRRTGDKHALSLLNTWLSDWCEANPAYRGPNWKCGQESSIRVMHLAMAAWLLGQDRESCPDLIRLVEAHLIRVYPTLSYAVAQDNNHGTSEAAALFIGGSWCRNHGIARGIRWTKKGRRLLENRVTRLIEKDGSFSQHSVNYHRLMLDTLCMVELWRRWQNETEFSPRFYERARLATHWLYSMVVPENGDAPNLGGNDGARLLPLADTDYRDYRPTVQLAMGLFERIRAYSGNGSYDLSTAWLNVDLADDCAEFLSSQQFDYGGYALLRKNHWFVLFRYPRYRFRPRHCDALHIDLWCGPENYLRDAGSFSYNTDGEWQSYFPGTAAHNTVQFDDRDQMPSLSRFLRGAWLRARDVMPVKEQDDSLTAAAGYCDWKGACHHRNVCLKPNALLVEDRISGFANHAILRWRLQPGDWQLAGNTVRCGSYALRVSADVSICRHELVEGWESRYYMQKTPLPVLEVETRSACTFTTEFKIA